MWVLMVTYLGIVKGSALSVVVIVASHVSVPCVCRSEPLEYTLSFATSWASKWESSSSSIHQPGRETSGPPGHQAELQQPGQSNTWAPEPARVRGLVTSLSRNMLRAHIYYKCLYYSYMAETLRFDLTINFLSKYSPVLLFAEFKNHS